MVILILISWMIMLLYLLTFVSSTEIRIVLTYKVDLFIRSKKHWTKFIAKNFHSLGCEVPIIWNLESSSTFLLSFLSFGFVKIVFLPSLLLSFWLKNFFFCNHLCKPYERLFILFLFFVQFSWVFLLIFF